MFRILIIFIIFCFQIQADQYDSRLDKLFDKLLHTSDDEEIKSITINIWDIWHETNDPTLNADFFRGIGLMNMGNIKRSIFYFTRVIEKNPKFAEAWNKRATAYYMLGQFELSKLDINQTLLLESRHFGAMDGMALIFLQEKKFKKAIEIYKKILTIFPKSKQTSLKIQDLLDQINQSA